MNRLQVGGGEGFVIIAVWSSRFGGLVVRASTAAVCHGHHLALLTRGSLFQSSQVLRDTSPRPIARVYSKAINIQILVMQFVPVYSLLEFTFVSHAEPQGYHLSRQVPKESVWTSARDPSYISVGGPSTDPLTTP